MSTLQTPASSHTLAGSSYLLIAAVAWGGMYGVSQKALQFLDPFSLTTVRYGIAALVFCLMLWMKEGLKAFSYDGQFVQIWLYGSCGFFGFSVLLFHGLKYAPAEHGAVIASLMPLISALICWVTKGKRPNGITLFCTLLAIAGVVLVISRGQVANLLQLDAIKGDLMIILAVTCWVIFSRGPGRVPSWSAKRYNTMSCCASLITIVGANAIASLFGVSNLPTPAAIEPVAFEVGYLILIAGVVAVSCWSTGVARLGPMNALLFMNMIPVFAFLIALAQGREIHPMEIYGMTLVITALLANNILPRFGKVQDAAQASP